MHLSISECLEWLVSGTPNPHQNTGGRHMSVGTEKVGGSGILAAIIQQLTWL